MEIVEREEARGADRETALERAFAAITGTEGGKAAADTDLHAKDVVRHG